MLNDSFRDNPNLERKIMRGRVDLVGKRFGKLTVLEPAGCDKHYKLKWLCQCDCGERITLVGSDMKKGNAENKSCGCARRVRVGIHSQETRQRILSKRDVEIIRKLAKKGVKQKDLAEVFEVSQEIIFEMVVD